MAVYGSYNLENGSNFQWNKTMPGLIDGFGFNKAFNIAMAETSARYMNRFIPFKDGNLSQIYETGQDSQGGFVKYVSPYSHYQYTGIGFNFSKEKHEFATSYWDKQMMIVDGVRITNELNMIRKRFAT